MPDIVDSIKLKKRKIEQLKREQANQEGQKEQLLKQLKDVSGTASVEEADKEIKKLGKELIEYEELLQDLDAQMAEIIEKAKPSQGST